MLCAWQRAAGGWEWEGAKQHERKDVGRGENVQTKRDLGNHASSSLSDTACMSRHLTSQASP